MSSNIATDLIKRHGSHHYINVKYGYFIFFLTLVHVAYLYISRRIYLQKWLTSGRSTTFKRLVFIPDYLFLTVWIVVLIVSLFWKFNAHEITSFVKRFGRFAYVLLPFDIFLSLKPNPLPNVYYLELIFLHKWISRISVFLGFTHAIGFVIVWLNQHTFIKVFKLLNFLGVIALISYLAIAAVSLRFVRRRAYKLFFTTHLILAWVLVILLQFHARPGVGLFTALNAVLFVGQIVTKFWKSTDVEIKKFTHAQSSLEMIQLNNVFKDSKDFHAGSHLRLSYSKFNWLSYILPSHPFSIASRPHEQVIKLIARKNTLNLKTGEVHSVFGPFPTLHQNFFKTADQVILIAGGSGISFILGVYSELIKNNSVNVTLIWVLKNEADLWVLEHFNIRKIDIYITGSKNDSNDEDDSEQVVLEENANLIETTDRESFELDELDPFDDTNDVRGTADEGIKNLKYGRPNLNSYSHKVEQYDKANNWIVSCGTDSLNSNCQKLAELLQVRYHGESYHL